MTRFLLLSFSVLFGCASPNPGGVDDLIVTGSSAQVQVVEIALLEVITDDI